MTTLALWVVSIEAIVACNQIMCWRHLKCWFFLERQTTIPSATNTSDWIIDSCPRRNETGCCCCRYFIFCTQIWVILQQQKMICCDCKSWTLLTNYHKLQTAICNTISSISAKLKGNPYQQMALKGHSHLCDRADLDASFCQFWKASTSTRNQKYASASRNPLQSSQCFIGFSIFYWKPVSEYAFVPPMILFYHIWLKTVWIASPTEHEKKRWGSVKAPGGTNRLRWLK